jgi:hypothetical protein
MAPSPRARHRTPPAPAAPAPRRWLLFVHQLPASPSNPRVRTWRRLQQLGAIQVRQAMYVLPDTAEAREDFEWLKTEVRSAGGDARLFTADGVDAWSDEAIVEAFRRASETAYLSLAAEIERAIRRRATARRSHRTPLPDDRRQLDRFRDRLAALERRDFFGAPGRNRVRVALARLEAPAHRSHGDRDGTGGSDAADLAGYANRLWVTRPRPGVDRMSSAWLVRRFVDPAARFAFAPDRDSLPADDAIPFDMFGAKFGHQGDTCTFETLCAVVGIEDRAVARIARIVHDLDLKDGRFGSPEASTVATIIDGMQLATSDDHELLERGITLFESLYRAFEQVSPAMPRARQQGGRARPRGRVRRVRGKSR